MKGSIRLLLVDDDRELCGMLAEYLESENFEIDQVYDGLDALSRIKTGRYDLVILDMMLPGLGGLEVLLQVRKSHSTPIIFLTARGDASDRIIGLELGADDYLAKPFEPRELLARINAVSRRGVQQAVEHDYRVDDIVLRPSNRSVFVSDQALSLTSVEYDLLLGLVKSAGRVVSRVDLAEQIGRQLLPFDRTIDMHIVNLRKKLGDTDSKDPRILTVRGNGYMLAVKGGPS